MVHLRTCAVAIAAGLGVCAGLGAAATYRLSDHPDGSANPPSYGLRLDGLFAGRAGATGGTTTFSFIDVLMNVTESGGEINIHIFGTVRGGEDTGSSYGYGLGDYYIDFEYTKWVVEDGTGYRADHDMLNNVGTLTAMSGVASGDVFDLHDKSNGSDSFLYLQDDHRLPGTGLANLDYWVGRGWLGVNGSQHVGNRDFLFVGELIPSPLGGSMAAVGVLGLAARRRR
ncbi:MAG: hypothetical protein ACTS27_04320 [Phycisphaerales bacterium]